MDFFSESFREYRIDLDKDGVVRAKSVVHYESNEDR